MASPDERRSDDASRSLEGVEHREVVSDNDEWETSDGGSAYRDAVRDADEWEMSDGGSAYRGDDGGPGSDDHDDDDGDSSNSLKKRPRGPGDLLLGARRISFVSAGSAAGPSGEHGGSRYPRSSDPALKAMPFPKPATEPGSLASNSTVAGMMKLMNYQAGSGLGKHGQGITVPIRVTMRPGNAGLGTIEGSYNNGLPKTDKWTTKWGDGGGANKEQYTERFIGWNWPDADGSRRRGQDFCEEILARVRELRAAALATQQVQDQTPELHDGSTAMLPMEEQALGDGGNKDVPDVAVAVITETMKNLVQEGSASWKLTAGDLIWEFTRLKEKFPEEYETYCLADTAATLVAPLLRPAFQGWKPLWDPTLLLDLAGLLKNILDDATSEVSPYAVLIDDTVVPAVRASGWTSTEPELMLRFLEAWRDALPPSAVQRIVEQVVMPELTREVESWEPRSAWEKKCHVWLRPWVELAGPLLESLYVTVRDKLEKGIRRWDASDAWESNYNMVSPWKALFDPASWEEFVDRINVLPNLGQGLRKLKITPPKQHKDSRETFSQLMKWAPLVRARDMALLLEAEFFGKWLDALRYWLRGTRPTSGEAKAWCNGWKRLFTLELLAEERVHAHLEAGLDMVNRAGQGLEI